MDITTNNISLSNEEVGIFSSQNNLYAKSENIATLNVKFEVSAKKSFFKPEEFYGKLSIDGKEYISTFSVEDLEEEPWLYSFPKSMSSVLESTAIYIPHDTGNWIQNFKAKLRGEKWIPLFILKDHESTKDIIIVNNLQELFRKDITEESDLTIQMGRELYTIKDVVLD